MSTLLQAPLTGAAATSSATACENQAAGQPQAASARTLGDLVDSYMESYSGRDPSRLYRLSEWKARLGDRAIAGVNDDLIFYELERIGGASARIYAGKDIKGRPIYGNLGKRSAPSVNRYHSALSAVFEWAIAKRRVPKGFENPCRKVGRQPENAPIVRFLSADECTRLLAACRGSKWARLYGVVLLALTTGARRGELQGLRWRDVNFELARAYVGRTKNGQPKTLPLTPAVVEELRRFYAEDLRRFRIGTPDRHVFHSRVRPDGPYHFEQRWYQALKRAQVRSFRFHDLRHTCASYLAQQGASLLEIADVLGHRQLAMVQRYGHLTVDSKTALVKRVLGEIK